MGRCAVVRIGAWFVLICLLVWNTAVAPSGVAAQGRDGRGSIVVDGDTRTYSVHLPPGYDGKGAVPLVLVLHGAYQTGAEIRRLSGFDAVADANGTIAVYPDGIGRHWADGRATSAQEQGVNDVAFLTALLDRLATEYATDRRRVYAAGFSNGGFMIGRLACDVPGRFAAVALVASAVSAQVAAECATGRAMPTIFMHGTADPIVPVAGVPEMRRGITVGPYLSTSESVAFWANRNGCAAPPAVTDLPAQADSAMGVRRESYMGCRDGADVVAYEIAGAGHIWPGGPQYLPVFLVGRTTQNLDGSAAIWRFFDAHPQA